MNQRILAIEGGGTRAAIAIAFLERMEALLSQQQEQKVRLGEWFDFIGGSSVSGIVACAAALGYSAAQVKTIYSFKTDRLRIFDDYETAPEW